MRVTNNYRKVYGKEYSTFEVNQPNKKIPVIKNEGEDEGEVEEKKKKLVTGYSNCKIVITDSEIKNSTPPRISSRDSFYQAEKDIKEKYLNHFLKMTSETRKNLKKCDRNGKDIGIGIGIGITDNEIDAFQKCIMLILGGNKLVGLSGHSMEFARKWEKKDAEFTIGFEWRIEIENIVSSLLWPIHKKQNFLENTWETLRIDSELTKEFIAKYSEYKTQCQEGLARLISESKNKNEEQNCIIDKYETTILMLLSVINIARFQKEFRNEIVPFFLSNDKTHETECVEALKRLTQKASNIPSKIFLEEIHAEYERQVEAITAIETKNKPIEIIHHAGQSFTTPISRIQKHKGSDKSYQKVFQAIDNSLRVTAGSVPGLAVVTGSTYIYRRQLQQVLNGVKGFFQQAFQETAEEASHKQGMQDHSQDSYYFYTAEGKTFISVTGSTGSIGNTDKGDRASAYAGYIAKEMAQSMRVFKRAMQYKIEPGEIALQQLQQLHEMAIQEGDEIGITAATFAVESLDSENGVGCRVRVTGHNVGNIIFAYIPSCGKLMTLAPSLQRIRLLTLEPEIIVSGIGAAIKYPAVFCQNLPSDAIVVAATYGLIDSLESLGCLQERQENHIIARSLNEVALEGKLKEFLPKNPIEQTSATLVNAFKELTARICTEKHMDNIALDRNTGAKPGIGGDITILAFAPGEHQMN